MRFNVLTIFPKLIVHYANESILGRAQKAGHIVVNAIDVRDFSMERHKKVDDTPYGGGPGMVMQAEPVYRALASLDALSTKAIGQTGALANGKVLKSVSKSVRAFLNGVIGRNKKKLEKRTVLLSPRGRQFDQRIAEEWSTLDEITFVCGRYEGVDQRVADYLVDEEISIGPYVLAGGELGALVIIEAVARLLPGVLGNQESLVEETFNRPESSDRGSEDTHSHNIQTEYPHYTKPADFMGWKVPEILLSGDHRRIQEWRKTQGRVYGEESDNSKRL